MQKCRTCRYLVLYGSVHGGLRSRCYCEHPKIKKDIKAGNAPKLGFVSFTIGWSKDPECKTAPRWCPMRSKYERGVQP